MTKVIALPEGFQVVKRTTKKHRKPRLTKKEHLFINEKFNASIIADEIKRINDDYSGRQDFIHNGVKNLIFSLVHTAKIEMGKLYVSDPAKLEEYFSDAYTALPIETNNAQLASFLILRSYKIDADNNLCANDETAVKAEVADTRKGKKHSTVKDYRKRLEEVGFIEDTQHFTKIKGKLIECEGGRKGYRLWLNKTWFGLDLAKNNAVSDTNLTALPSAPNPLISRDSSPSILPFDFTIVKSFEKEDSKSGDFFAKSQEVSLTPSNPLLKGFSKDRDSELSKIAPSPAAAPILDMQPSPAAIANKTAQDLTNFGEKIAKQVETTIYEPFQAKGQVKISKDKSLNAPLTDKQRGRILEGSLKILLYFAKKMPLADAFAEITEGVKDAAKDLKRNKENFVYMPENWLCVAQTDGVFRMNKAGLRYIIENWDCSEKTVIMPKVLVNQSIETIFTDYFFKLSRFGLEEHTFRRFLNDFAQTGKLMEAKDLIDQFLRKNAQGKLTQENRIGYLIRMWKNLKNQKAGEKVDYEGIKLVQKDQEQLGKEFDAQQARNLAQKEVIERETVVKAVIETKKKTQAEKDSDFAQYIWQNNPDAVKNVVHAMRGLSSITMDSWKNDIFLPRVGAKLREQLSNEFKDFENGK